MSQSQVIVVGLGQLGGVFARGFLRSGHTVVPINRGGGLDGSTTSFELAVIAVGEKDLAPALAGLDESVRARAVLVQNDLLPTDIAGLGLAAPTIAVVWFEKKAGKDVIVIRSTPIYGPHADLVAQALGAIGIAAHVVTTEQQLLFELVAKSLYIAVTNVSGLAVGGDVGTLIRDHRDLMDDVTAEVLMLVGPRLGGQPQPSRALIMAHIEASIAADPTHRCMGRSAPARLARLLEAADRQDIDTPRLKQIAERAREEDGASRPPPGTGL